MKRIGAWVAVVAVLLFGAYVAMVMLRPPSDGKVHYQMAEGILRASFGSGSTFEVSGLEDQRTHLVRISGGFEVRGVMRSDDPRLGGTVRELPFRVRVEGPRKTYVLFGPNEFKAQLLEPSL